MKVFIRILKDSISLAFQELYNNKLRSFLSLSGITIGIFCIISVFSAVGSLESEVRTSFEQLGDDVLYVEKQPWTFSRDNWKYARHPEANLADFKAVRTYSEKAENVVIQFILINKSVIYKSSDVTGLLAFAISHEYDAIYKFDFAKGRYFSSEESVKGDNKIILGADVADNLFPEGVDPIGKPIKMMGRKMIVVGVLEKAGESLLNWNYDKTVMLPYYYALKLVNKNSALFAQRVVVSAKPDVVLTELKDEIRGIMRRTRRLSPRDDDNFAMNELSIFTQGLNKMFLGINLAGAIIGIFSILVGGFGIANIMFVTVKERTNLIGIKKAVGAKSKVILLEFLVESIVLCLIGGLIGILLVLAGIYVANSLINFTFVLSLKNVAIGVIISILIGLLSGFVPALKAARMNPVEAIRFK